MGYTDIWEVDADAYTANTELLEAEACCTGGMKSSPIASLLILWGMDVMVKRYKQQL